MAAEGTQALVRTGQTIDGRYRVVEELGRGAFAVTLRCERIEDGAIVAIKELRLGDLGDFKPLDLFEREAKVMGAIEHPHIPDLYEAFEGTTDEGTPAFFLVQELIEGPSLAERIESGPLLGEADILQIAMGMLDILEYLHTRAPPVFHRDIKPSNIIVTKSGSPVLIDFGGVCFGWRPPNQTGTTVVGTYGYMPPEQLLGQVNATADLYALGATLLHAATGTPPHEFPFDTGQYEIPDDVPVRPGLLAMIRACLRTAPNQRPPDAATARDILLERSQALVPIDGGASAMVKANATLDYGTEAVPHFVEMPPPPRDRDGDYADVYCNLIYGDPKVFAGPFVAHLIAGVFTLGFTVWIHNRALRKRRKRCRALFEAGHATVGQVVAVAKDSNLLQFEYVVDGTKYRNKMTYGPIYLAFYARGEPVAVLYDPVDPDSSCVVFRLFDDSGVPTDARRVG